MLSLELATARTWAEIDVDILLANYHGALAELSSGVKHIAVLKANAYGAGAVPIAKILYGEGARLFAVACQSEALELRTALPDDADILVMGATMPPEIPRALDCGIVCTVTDLQGARALSAQAVAAGKTARVHAKVDTGLNRFGFSASEAAPHIAEIAGMPGLRLEGVYSHLQRRSTKHDQLQAERLLAVRDGLISRGVAIPMLHLLDSIGMWRYPEHQFDAVRDAAFLIGHTPRDYPRPERLRFSLSFKTRIVRVFQAAAGECLGYDADHPLEKPARVATLCVGYADGYPRAMSHVGQVEIHGKRAKVLGVVCMDLMMVDVGDIPEAAVGDVATLLGGGIDIWEYIGFFGGYINESISMISRRVPRVYLRGGEVIEIAGYMP